jgi:hypothetical protein
LSNSFLSFLFSSDLKGLHLARSISAAILNDGIVLPIRVVQELIDIKETEQKGEGVASNFSNSMYPVQLYSCMSNQIEMLGGM